MVLDGATASPSTDTFPDDSSPSSDSDPYASSSSSSSSSTPSPSYNSTRAIISVGSDLGQTYPHVFPPGYRGPTEGQLIPPFPILGPLYGFGKQTQTQRILQAAFAMAKSAERPLTQTECDALTYHVSKGQSIASFGGPLGNAFGIWRWFRTQNTMRFPFYQPSEGALSKAYSYATPRILNTLRGTAYFWLGGFLGKIFFATYAISVAIAGQKMDDRLKDLWGEVGKKVKNKQWAEGFPPRNVTSVPAQGMQQREQSLPYGNYSNTAQANGQASLSSSQTGGFDDQSAQQPQGWNPRLEDDRLGVADRETGFREDSAASQPAEFGFDDASPTAGNEGYKPIDSSTSQGSAWARLRGQGGTERGSLQPGRPGDGDAWARTRGAPRAEQGQKRDLTSDESSSDDGGWK